MSRRISTKAKKETIIIAWKLCTTMKADDVTDTLELALKASGCVTAVSRKPR